MLPAFVDLRPAVDVVEDQGFDNACTGYGGAKAMDILWERAGQNKQFACEFLWYQIKSYNSVVDWKTGNNGGQYFGSIFSALTNTGICEHSFYPDNTPIDTKPSVAALANAAQYRIDSYTDLQNDTKTPQRIKTALAQGYPVVLIINIYGIKWDNLSVPWTQQTATKATDGRIGLHCIPLIGYDDASQNFLMQNSWGPKWGDGGFAGIPYALMDTSQAVYIHGGVIDQSLVPVVNAGYVAEPIVGSLPTMDQLASFQQYITLAAQTISNAPGPDGQYLWQNLLWSAAEMARGCGISDEAVATYCMGRFGPQVGQNILNMLRKHKYFG